MTVNRKCLSISVERDPKKRRVKPVETQASILDFDLDESSDDSDFRIEDHPDNSDDDSLSLDSDAQGNRFVEFFISFTIHYYIFVS